MKKLIELSLLSILIISLLPLKGSFKVEADGYYPMACAADEFEVSYINDDGSLSKVSCHSSFDEAKQAMKANENYVVRVEEGYSPTKIIAMNSGLAYSYPNRRSSSIMDLYQNPRDTGSSQYKTTYMPKGYEMFYYDTYSARLDGKGYIQMEINGFEGFADLEYTDLVPFKYINKGIPIYLGGYNGDLAAYGYEYPYLVKLEQNYYKIETNGNYMDMVFYNHYAYGTNGEKAVLYSMSVDNAQNYLDAGMPEGVKSYSNDGTNFYSDYKLTNKVATVYNYYQFLSLRTKTGISASTLDSFISSRSGSVLKGEGQSFIDAQNEYGFNALLIYAMACHESAYGTSFYAVNRNNLFGWNAFDDSPSDASYFSSVASCVDTHMGRYINWFTDFTNWRYFGTFLGNKGAGLNVKYASDPYWGQGIASLAYSIDKYANGKNGKLTDYNRYQLAYVAANYNDVIHDSNIRWDAPFYKRSGSASSYYTGQYGKHYQKDLIVAIIGEENGRYKTQATNPIEDGALVVDDGKLPYDWNSSIVYLDKNDVTLLYKNDSVEPDPDEIDDTIAHDPITIVDEMKLDGGVLNISGVGIISAVNMINNDKVKHVIEIYDLKDNSKVDEFGCENYDTSWYNLNDGYSYTFGGFKGSYDLNKLGKGTYFLKLKTSYADKIERSDVLRTSLKNLALFKYETDNGLCKVATNDVYGYRIEIDVTDKLINYADITKPSIRSSLATIDEVSYDTDNHKIVFDGVGMMFYLNYDNDSITHNLYLVGDKNVVKADTSSHGCPIDFKAFYESSYNMDKICYTASADLNELDGDYHLYLEVINGDYRDLIELNNRYNTKYRTLDSDELKTSFLNEAIRYRMVINVNHLKEAQ